MSWELQPGQNLSGQKMKSNFVSNHIRLNGNVHGHKLQLCNKCEEMRLPEGGVQMSASRWICASCWTNRVTSQNFKEMSR
jgi:formylmethanofuran dehydrogenase subunit E